jgi:Domain of unknown function (DUF4279)
MKMEQKFRRRTVEFVVISNHRSGDQLSSEIGIDPDEVRSGSGRFAHEVAWVLRTAGDGNSDLSTLIEDLLARVEPGISAIERIVTGSDDAVVLRVIQYISDDPVGPGFSLTSSLVQTLARVRAMVDVDQYLDVEASA